MRLASLLGTALLLGSASCTYEVPGLEDGGLLGAATPNVDASVDGGGVFPSEAGSGGHPPDAGAAADGPCTGLLCACTTNAECSSPTADVTPICAQSSIVGADLGHAGFCTQPCCTSADCADDTVCFASGQGGNYCVDPAWLGRSAPGASVGGVACTAGTQCRSGLCLANGACADTCCSFGNTGAECAGGWQCAFGDFPGNASFDNHFSGRCGPPGGSGALNDTCSQNSDCAGGLCVTGGGPPFCTEPCSTSTGCGGGNDCTWYEEGTDVCFACLPQAGNGPNGSQCSNDGQCLNYWCNGSDECTSVCFNDAACTSVSGWHCTPQQENVSETATYYILGCGP
jgi:hypothetical protein